MRRILGPLVGESPELQVMGLMRRWDLCCVLNKIIKDLFPVPYILGMLCIMVPHWINFVSFHSFLLLHVLLKELLGLNPNHCANLRGNSMIDYLKESPLLTRLANFWDEFFSVFFWEVNDWNFTNFFYKSGSDGTVFCGLYEHWIDISHV